jgi:hypothetical protein
MLFRFATLALILTVLVLASVQAASAQTTPAAGSQPLNFLVNIKPHNSNQQPWTGDLTIKINPEGIITGTYRSTSTRPDPFRGNIINVTGGLSGKNINLEFGTKGYFPVKGEYEAGAGIVGTAYSKVSAGSASKTSLAGPPAGVTRLSTRPTPVPMPATTVYDFVAKEEAK